jgi:hypothetical protein
LSEDQSAGQVLSLEELVKKVSELVKGKAKGRGKVPGKMLQRIWLHPKTYSIIYSIAESLEVAPNVVCESIIEAFFDLVRGGQFQGSTSDKAYACPKCGKEFKSVAEWYDHLKYRIDELRTLIQDLVSLKLGGAQG